MQRPRPDTPRLRPRPYPSASATLARRLATWAEEPPLRAPNSLAGPGEDPDDEAAEQRQGWDWESWAERSEQISDRLVRALERMTWGGLGALVGMAITAAPSLGVGSSGYPFVFIQPLGAAVGAVAGIAVLAYRARRSPKTAAPRRWPGPTAAYLETARRQRRGR